MYKWNNCGYETAKRKRMRKFLQLNKDEFISFLKDAEFEVQEEAREVIYINKLCQTCEYKNKFICHICKDHSLHSDKVEWVLYPGD